MERNNGIAFFDMDGTITSADTFFHFLVFDRGWARVLIGAVALSPWLLLYVLKAIKADKAKEIVFGYFFKGRSVESLRNSGGHFCKMKLPMILRQDRLNEIALHKDKKHVVCVVSASSDIWLKEWCTANDLLLLSTEYECANGFLTGKYSKPNCNGDEKVNRIREAFSLGDYRHIYAYGNSSGDEPMLRLANATLM